MILGVNLSHDYAICVLTDDGEVHLYERERSCAGATTGIGQVTRWKYSTSGPRSGSPESELSPCLRPAWRRLPAATGN